MHVLLEILRDCGDWELAVKVLKDMGSETGSAGSTSTGPISLTSSGRAILGRLHNPTTTSFALVMEACLSLEDPLLLAPDNVQECGRRSQAALEVFSQMEEQGLKPDRYVDK